MKKICELTLYKCIANKNLKKKSQHEQSSGSCNLKPVRYNCMPIKMAKSTNLKRPIIPAITKDPEQSELSDTFCGDVNGAYFWKK